MKHLYCYIVEPIEGRYSNKTKVNDSELILTGRLEYEGLQAHMEEALKEKGLNHKNAVLCPEIALFSKSYYNSICSLDHFKKYDFFPFLILRNFSYQI